MGVKRKLNLCVAEKYLDTNKQEKVRWNVVGRMVELDDSKTAALIKINLFPGVVISAFPMQDQNADHEPQGRPTPQQQASNRPANQGTASASNDGLPF